MHPTIPHTPGPWYLEERSKYQTHDADRIIYRLIPIRADQLKYAEDGRTHNQQSLARVYGDGILYPSNPERLANAEVMAAAPELLAALLDCVECLYRLPDTPGAFRVTCLSQARAAIAKVRGDRA